MSLKVRSLISEPFIHFLILGGLLYLFVSFFQKQTEKKSLEITVDKEQVNLIIINYKTQTGSLPSKLQLDAMIDDEIKEEIFFREAKKMGLDKDDEIIRRRLSQKFDFLQTDLVEIPSPSEEILKQFYEKNPALFINEKTVTFSHIYFSTDNSTDSIARQRAFIVLKQLQKTKLERAPEKGDHFSLQYDYTNQAMVDIQQNFGDKPIVQELFKASLNIWTGPVQSGYGWHLIYVTKIDSAKEMPFVSIKEEVKMQYILSEKAKQNKKNYDELSEKYIINRKYLESK